MRQNGAIKLPKSLYMMNFIIDYATYQCQKSFEMAELFIALMKKDRAASPLFIAL